MGDIDTQAAQVASRNPYVVDDNSLPQHVQFNHVKNHIAQKYHIDQIGISKSSVDNSSYSDKHVSYIYTFFRIQKILYKLLKSNIEKTFSIMFI